MIHEVAALAKERDKLLMQQTDVLIQDSRMRVELVRERNALTADLAAAREEIAHLKEVYTIGD